jgi:hypothetical protein
MDASWSVTKCMTKLAQRHGVWTSYWASYPTLRIYDEIWQFVMDAVWSMTKSENVMWISSWITRFFVVSLVVGLCTLLGLDDEQVFKIIQCIYAISMLWCQNGPFAYKLLVCSFVLWLVTSVDLFWKKSIAGWCVINHTDKAGLTYTLCCAGMVAVHMNIQIMDKSRKQRLK